MQELACQERLAAIAGCAFKGPEAAMFMPDVRFISQDEYRAEIEAQGSSGSDFQPIWERFEDVLVALELTRDGAFSPRESTDFAVATFVAYYSNANKNITLITGDEERDELITSIIFVHETIHALQDIEHDLVELNRRPFTFDQQLHTGALLEGEARFHENRVLAAMQGLDETRLDLQKAFHTSRTSGEARIFAQEELYLTGSVALRYEYGTEYVSRLWHEAGPAAVRQRFEATPLSSYYALSTVWGHGDEAIDVIYPAVYPETDNGTPVFNLSFGPWGVYLIAKRHELEQRDAEELALAWRGDQLTVLELSDGGTAGRWEIYLEDASAAERLAAAFNQSEGVTAEGEGARVIAAVLLDEPWLLGELP